MRMSVRLRGTCFGGPPAGAGAAAAGLGASVGLAAAAGAAAGTGVFVGAAAGAGHARPRSERPEKRRDEIGLWQSRRIAPAQPGGRVSAEPDVLDVKGLRVYYHTARGPVKAVDGVSFALAPGERFGLVGE